MKLDDRATLELTGLTSSLAKDGRPSLGLHLRVETGAEPGPSFSIGARPVSIGSGDDCEIVLADRSVSRKHARVTPVRDGVRIKDVGSTNGTFVGDARVFETVVAVGESFRLGNIVLRVVDSGTGQIEPSSRRWLGALIGESLVMREIFAVLERAAPSDATVLIEGPSGTGKELAARALHDHSLRARGPFVAFECGVVTRDLLQSALMGHVKGAFTGADRDRPGAFAEANRGTIFLDEIGELPLDSQAHLLRALEAGECTPVGGDRPRAIDVRVVAATNRNLYTLVEQGTFRLDLFHRLAVVHLRMPALRQHLDDLPVLIASFYQSHGVEPGPVDGPNLERLHRHPFEGNVRELRNILERSLVLCDPAHRAFRDLPLIMRQTAVEAAPPAVSADINLPFKEAKEAVVELFERDYLPKLVTRFNGNVSQAAAHAGLSRQHLTALLAKHGLKPESR